ncbi:11381_t:CDS:2 [Diversispora eburnea]|uniref:11381_t:CDS:1 n=1 Tax=Diversispora eburnea TaxID=1213867 RepID=A0A9N8YME0_9GLOM|nr:11381_t:CDS:2 [Diversispora eburnea]
MEIKGIVGLLIFYMLLDLISFQALAIPIAKDNISTYNSSSAHNINLKTRQDVDYRVIQVQIPKDGYKCLEVASYNSNNESDFEHVTFFIDGYDPNHYFSLGDSKYAYTDRLYSFRVSKDYFIPPGSDHGVCEGSNIRTEDLKPDFYFKTNWWVSDSNFQPRLNNDYRIIKVQIPEGNYQCLRAISYSPNDDDNVEIYRFIDGYDSNRYYSLGNLMYAYTDRHYFFMVAEGYFIPPGGKHGYCRGSNMETHSNLKLDFSFETNWWMTASNFRN